MKLVILQPGFESRHNLTYWDNQSIMGLVQGHMAIQQEKASRIMVR